MDRVYMNRRTGEERIHVEIDAGEIHDLLAELEAQRPLDATRRLVEILRTASDALPVERPAGRLP